MGHERVGYLPKTKRWNSIVKDIGGFSSNPDIVSEVAVATTKNVREKYKVISADEGVLSAFKFLIILSFSTKQEDSINFLSSKGVKLSSGSDLLDIGISAKSYLEKHFNSKEYSSIATESLLDTLSNWYQKNASNQNSLFALPNNPLEKWKKASTGEGFCEISRLFFSNFTKRYLEYFLEREAGWHLKTVNDRKLFKDRLASKIEEVSLHAFETTKITQSFSAGWFNKNVKDKLPSDRKIQGFVDFAFAKINSELLREENQ